MINELTKKQEADLIKYREECYQWGIKSGPVDMDKFTNAMNIFYSKIGKESPYVWRCGSIWQCQVIINMFRANLEANLEANLGDNLWANLGANLGDNLGANLWANLTDNLGDNLRANLWANLGANLGDNLRANLRDNLGANLGDNLRANLWANLGDNLKYISTYFWGQEDYYWVAFYRFCETIGIKYKKEESKILSLWEDIARSAHWWYPFEKIVFVSDRPEIRTNERRQLHNNDGPAVLYPDGYCQYYLNGRSVPEWICETPAEKLDIKEVMKIGNVEVRAQAIKKVGLSRISDRADRLDSKGVYSLLDFRKLIGADRAAPYLKMINPSTGETHIEGVHPDCKTVQHAINWRASGDINKTWKPIVLT